MGYTLSSSVYMLEVEKDIILLDLTQQRYKLIPFNEQFYPTQFFTTLLAGDPIPSSFQEGIATCLQAGWIREEEAKATEIAPLLLKHWWLDLLPLRIEALFLFRIIENILKNKAFLPLVQTLESLPTGACQENEVQIIRSVREMASVFREKKTCLHQSLVMFWMLRKRGFPAHVEIRVWRDPLYGHMLVREGDRVLSWKPGLISITTLEHFLSASALLFHSGELSTHYRQWEAQA